MGIGDRGRPRYQRDIIAQRAGNSALVTVHPTSLGLCRRWAAMRAQESHSAVESTVDLPTDALV